MKFLLLTLLVLNGFLLTESKPLKVYVLAGSSNAQGRAAIDHLKERIDSDLEKNIKNQYTELFSEQEGWKVFNKVFVSYEPVRHEDWFHGPVSVHAPFSFDDNSFGPEVGMAQVLSKVYEDPIIIVKCAWDSKTLNEDFRPPSSGGEAGFEWFNCWNQIEKTISRAHEVVGEEFTHLVPELRGFIWWQGYLDLFKRSAIDNYRQNLENLVRDFRVRAGNPNLPVIIGELGGSGNGEEINGSPVPPREVGLRKIQYEVANLPEFERTTMFVKTSHYVHPYEPRFESNTHYYGLGDTMVDIGQAFADAALALDRRYEEILSNDQREGEIMSMGNRLQAMFLILLVGLGVLGYAYVKKVRSQKDLVQVVRSLFLSPKAKHEDGASSRGEIV